MSVGPHINNRPPSRAGSRSELIGSAVADDNPLGSLSQAALIELLQQHASEKKALRDEIENLQRTVLDQRLEASKRSIYLRQGADIVADRRKPMWLVRDVLEREVLAVLAGPRSTFKSLIALDWTMTAVCDGHPAIILSGEGNGLGRRMEAWHKEHAPETPLDSLPVWAVEHAFSLRDDENIQAIKAAIHGLGVKPKLIVIDTLSKYSAGLEENSNSEVAEFLSRLAVELRDNYQCTVLLVTHTGHSDTSRPRGASVLMANPDAEYIVTRPDRLGMKVSVTRERFKDGPSLPPLGYQATEVELDDLDDYGRSVTSLALRPIDAPKGNAVRRGPRGKVQRQLLKVLRERQRQLPEPVVWSHDQIRSIGEELGIAKTSIRSAVESLVEGQHLLCGPDGWVLASV